MYYVEASGLNQGTGTYTLSVREVDDPPDDSGDVSEADTDFPADTTTSGRVEVGGSVTGNIASTSSPLPIPIDFQGEDCKTHQHQKMNVRCDGLRHPSSEKATAMRQPPK